jgi:hypothetical protein
MLAEIVVAARHRSAKKNALEKPLVMTKKEEKFTIE